MSASVFKASELLVGATVNAVCQGALVALLAALALRWCVRTNAATRHAVWWGILLVVAALVPANVGMEILARQGSPTPAPASRQTPPQHPQPQTAIIAPAPTPTWPAETALAPLDGAASSAPSEETAANDVSAGPVTPEAATTAPEISATESAPWNQPAAPRPPQLEATKRWSQWRQAGQAWWKSLGAQWKTAVHLPRTVCLGLVGAWALLASLRLGMVAGRAAEIRRVKANSQPASAARQDLFDRLWAAAGMKRAARLLVSHEHGTAMALGFLHPVALLPAQMDQEADEREVEQVLRHELAHLARRDDWGNLWQQVIEAALFFHPAVWWISPQLSLEREIACDDLVLEASGAARGYALTLANAAGRLRLHRDLAAPGVSGKNSQLQQRINMILNTQRDRSSRLAKRWPGFFTAAAAGLAALAIMAGPRLVLADPPPTPASNDASAATTTPADGTPAALPGDSTAETGPRTKSGSDSVAPAAPVPPPPPEPPAAPEPPQPAAIAVAPEPMNPPSPPAMAWVAPEGAVVAAAPMPRMALITTEDVSDNDADSDDDKDSNQEHARAHGKDQHLSVEERLDRLEKILAELEVRDGGKGRRHMVNSAATVSANGSADAGSPMDLNLNVRPDISMNFDWVAKLASHAAAEAQRSAEAGQRAAEAGQRAADQAMRDMAKFDGNKMQWKQLQADASRQQIQALRQARQSLQSQVHSLDEQIKRLEKDKEQMDAQRDKLNAERDAQKDKAKDKEKGDSSETPSPEKE